MISKHKYWHYWVYIELPNSDEQLDFDFSEVFKKLFSKLLNIFLFDKYFKYFIHYLYPEFEFKPAAILNRDI